MMLILLAVSLTVLLCVVAYNFAVYALPFMVGLAVFRYVYSMDSGFPMSALAAIGAALLSVALVVVVLGFAKNPALRLIALTIFAVPAMVAGYVLVHGVTKNVVGSTIALNLLRGAGGVFIGVASMLNLNSLRTAVLSR